MLRKLIFLGVGTGIAAAVPVFLDRNPALFEHTEKQAAAPSPDPAPTAALARPEAALTGRKVQLKADQTGHFGGTFEMNGRDVPALVDTGATLVAINRSTARRLGIKLDQSDFKYEVRTANGKTHAAGVVLDRVVIGRVEVTKVEAMVLDDSALSQTLIGMSFLKQLSRYAVTDGTLVLEQ